MTVVLDLPQEKESALKAKAEAHGVTAEEYAQQVLDRDLDVANPIEPPDNRPIWEVIQDIMKDVPDEVFERFPEDGASQVDHYIYGTPKRY